MKNKRERRERNVQKNFNQNITNKNNIYQLYS